MTCSCAKCRRRRGELVYDSPPHLPTDPEGCAVRLLDGITDRAEAALIAAAMFPGEGQATRAVVMDVAARLAPDLPRGVLVPALDRLLACGFLAEESGEVRPTSLAEATRPHLSDL